MSNKILIVDYTKIYAILLLFCLIVYACDIFFFFFSSRRRHTRYWRDWSSDVCSSDLAGREDPLARRVRRRPADGGAVHDRPPRDRPIPRPGRRRRALRGEPLDGGAARVGLLFRADPVPRRRVHEGMVPPARRAAHPHGWRDAPHRRSPRPGRHPPPRG